MTQTRPDLLPFALPHTVGLPFHGLVRSGALTLPDASTMAYPQPFFSGETVLVRGQQSSVPTRTVEQMAADAAANYQWLDYAILSGSDRDIGGESLDAWNHLYCDENYNWIISIDITPGAGSCTIETWLEKPFGVFSGNGQSFSMARRKLAELECVPTAYDGSAIPADRMVGTSASATYSEHGDAVIINLKSTATDPLSETSWYWTEGQHDVIRIRYSGNGSLVPGTIGAGIAAVIDVYASAQNLAVDPYSLTTTATYPPYDDPTETSHTEFGGTWRYRYAIKPDGTIGYLQRDYRVTSDLTLTQDSPENWSQQSKETLAVDTYTYFDSTFVSYQSQSGTGLYEAITSNINGNETVYYNPYVGMPGYNLTGGTVYQLEPGLLYFRGSYKTALIASHYGVARDAVGGELQGWNWTVEPVAKVISSDETALICYV